MGVEKFDMEARWHGELGERERREIKEWAKKAAAWGRCELRLGRARSRVSMTLDKVKLEERSREHIGYVETMLREQEGGEAAQALSDMRQGKIGDASGLLVKDYGSVLARDWAAQTSASLQAFIPPRCGLKIQLGNSWAESLAFSHPASSAEA